MTPGAGDQIRPGHKISVPDNVLRLYLETNGIDPKTPVAVVGVRGFVATPGEEAGANQIGIYDDAICVVTPTMSRTFLGNTDPSRTIAGRAILVAPQVLWLCPGIHHATRPPADRRPAFIQDGGARIQRYTADNVLGDKILEDQWGGFNLHDGSITTTGSEACQTVVPEEWVDFRGTVSIPLGIPAEEWLTVAARVKLGEPAPAHWAAARFPYILVT